MKKFFSFCLALYMLMSLFCVSVSAYGECDIHADINFDDYCDRCNQYAISSTPGLNATAVISDGVLVIVVYNNGVKHFSYLDTELHYNPEKLECYATESTSENGFTPAIGNLGNIIIGQFLSYDLGNIPDDEPFILYIATFILKDVFTADDIPDLILKTHNEVVMYSAETYKANEVLCFDTTHPHIDDNNDAVCDICSQPLVIIGDVNCDSKITSADARLALRMAANLEQPTEYAIFVADFDGNGKITAAEARKILRVSAKIDSF